jgi:hypothetical protein
MLCVFVRKGLTAKDIHKEMFPVYGGKCSQLGLINSLKDVEITTGATAQRVVEMLI